MVRLGPDIDLVTIGGALSVPGPSRWRRRPILAPAGGAPPLSLLSSAPCPAVTSMDSFLRAAPPPASPVAPRRRRRAKCMEVSCWALAAAILVTLVLGVLVGHYIPRDQHAARAPLRAGDPWSPGVPFFFFFGMQPTLPHPRRRVRSIAVVARVGRVVVAHRRRARARCSRL